MTRTDFPFQIHILLEFSSFPSFLRYYDIFQIPVVQKNESHRFSSGQRNRRRPQIGPWTNRKRLPRQREPEEKAGGQFLVLPKIETSISRSDRCQSAAHRCPPARKIDSVSIVSPGLVARRKISWEAKGDSLPFAFSLFSSADFFPPLSTTIYLPPLSSFCYTGRFRNTVSILDRVNLRSKIRKKCKYKHLGKIFCIFSRRKNCMDFFLISFESLEFNKNRGVYVCMIYMEQFFSEENIFEGKFIFK